jgi:small subunit ribosomal protein S16
LGGFTKELAVHIRLRRVGKTKAPTYRVVIADSRAPRNGKFIESIGHYNPRSEPADLVVNADRARHWIKNGARPTATARSLLVRSGLSDTEVPPVAR